MRHMSRRKEKDKMALEIREMEALLAKLGVDMHAHGSRVAAAELLQVAPQTIYKIYRDGFASAGVERALRARLAEAAQGAGMRVELGEALDKLSAALEGLENVSLRLAHVYELEAALKAREEQQDAPPIDLDKTEGAA